MTKSTITREENIQAVFDLKAGYTLGLADVEILKRVARIALGAMDSEPVAWSNGCNKSVPAALRYLAEKPRPRGGESSFNTAHLYQLAREIELMAEAPLYRHAQQPVVPFGLHPDTQKLVIDFCTALAEKLYKAQLKYGYDADWKQDGWPSQCQAHFHQHIAKGDPRDVAAYCAFMWYHGWKTEAAQTAPVVTFYRDGIEAAAKWIDKQREAYDSEHGWSDPDTGAFEFGNDAQREYSSTLEELAEVIRALHQNAGNSPVIPNGYVMVPKEPTAQMYDAGDRQMTTKQVWDAMLAAAPQPQNSPQNIPEIIPGWIPVSERMPETYVNVLLTDEHDDVCIGQLEFEGDIYFYVVGSTHRHKATHWMPLPAAPQEVKGD